MYNLIVTYFFYLILPQKAALEASELILCAQELIQQAKQSCHNAT